MANILYQENKKHYMIICSPIINKEVILLVSKDDGKDYNVLDVVNGDSFLALNQNGLAVCDTFENENGGIGYYVVCFYDTSDVKEYEKTTWDISRHPEQGKNFDGLGNSDLIIIDDNGNLLKCSQKTSLFESKKFARKSIKESKVMTFEEFKKLCNDNFRYAIMDFNEYKGAYIVVVSSNEKATELFTKALRKKVSNVHSMNLKTLIVNIIVVMKLCAYKHILK